jgi:hypothetical protein
MSAKIKNSNRGYRHYRPKGIKPHHFERVYWPYLPLIAVVAGLVWYGRSNGNFDYAVQYGVKGQAYDPQLAVLPFTSHLAAIAIWSVFFAAIGTLVFKHSRQLKRSLLNGERYVLSHPVLDFGLVTIVALTYLISQTSFYTF